MRTGRLVPSTFRPGLPDNSVSIMGRWRLGTALAPACYLSFPPDDVVDMDWFAAPGWTAIA